MKNTKDKNRILDSRVTPSKKVAWRIYKRGALIQLLPLAPRPKSAVFVFNGLQKDIWRQIKNRLTMGQIVERIARKEKMGPEDVEEEVVTFVKQLRTKQLVDISYVR